MSSSDPFRPFPLHPSKLPGSSPRTHLTPTKFLTKENSRSHLAYAWTARRKWILLTVISSCQTSTAFNTASYSNAVPSLNTYFGIENAQKGIATSLISHAVGYRLWRPFSEDMGRKSVTQASLGLTNMSVLICASSGSFGGVIGGRIVARCDVTMSIIEDMFDKEEQFCAVLWASLFTCLGAVLAGVARGAVQQFLDWRWTFWLQFVLGVATQFLHWLLAEEMRVSVLLDREAERQREEGNMNIYGPNYDKAWMEMYQCPQWAMAMLRPYEMLISEPIILTFALLSGYIDTLIFSFFERHSYLFQQWLFTPTSISFILVALTVSCVVGYCTFVPFISHHNARRTKGEKVVLKTRLDRPLYYIICLPHGLLICAFVVAGLPLHWFGVVVTSVLIGIANIWLCLALLFRSVYRYTSRTLGARKSMSNPNSQHIHKPEGIVTMKGGLLDEGILYILGLLGY
ncbi:major facilitator superfamily domain-containing protein [Bipolaris maydis]|nr:major facilitator superfamily domain-containing protein [Bipolaris maydis]